MIFPGDSVRPKRTLKCDHLNRYFDGYETVVRIKSNVPEVWDYMGSQMIYIIVDGKEMGFYSSVLDKRSSLWAK